MGEYQEASVPEVKNWLENLSDLIISKIRGVKTDETANLEDLINSDLIENHIMSLVATQQERNEDKYKIKIHNKTLEQTQGYIQRLFTELSEDKFLLHSGLMMLYVESKGPDATFNGLQKYIKANSHRSFSEVTKQYFERIWENDKDRIYDLIANSHPVMV